MKIKGKYGNAILYATNVAESTKEQVLELMNQRFIKGLNVRIMPDCHTGIGCVIGTTMKIKDSCVPNLVGVDIGCGMLTVNLGKLNIDLEKLDNFISNNIPSGNDVYDKVQQMNVDIKKLYCYEKLNNKKRLECSIGTLGGGNHFIEIDKDDEDNLYLVIHTGSRNLGAQVCELYMKVAKDALMERRNKAINETAKRLKETGNTNLIQKEINKINEAYEAVNKKLLPLYDDNFKNYLHDMNICQEFAWENREAIANKILSHLGLEFSQIQHFHTVHNYINMNDMILRKGAIAAYKGEMVLIPINMRDGSIIAIGKSNKKYNYSAPHGAGRLISRNKAKECVSLEDYKASMEGIYSSCICMGTIDESPFAYKPIEDILPNIVDTVDVIKIIKPIYNFKAK